MSSSPSLQPPPAGAIGGGTTPYSAASSFLPSFMIIAALLAFVFLASVSIHLLLRFLSDRSTSSSSGPPLPRTHTHRRDEAAGSAWGTADASSAARPAAAAPADDAGKKEAAASDDEKQRLIDSLPLFTMASALAALPKSSPDCAVCLSPFTPDAELRLLPACRHAFHAACVDAWLRTAAPSCPLCRAAVVALPHPSLYAMLAAATAQQQRTPPSPWASRDRSGSSFLIEMGRTVSNRGSPGGGGDRNTNSRTYSLGSFDYQIDEEVEAVVSRVARITARESSAVKEEKPSAEEGSAPAPSPAPPGETVAEAAGSSRGWLREYVDRLASSAYTLSERWSSRWSQGQSQQQRQEEPWLWDAEAADMSAPPGSDEEEEETAFMVMYRWISGV